MLGDKPVAHRPASSCRTGWSTVAALGAVALLLAGEAAAAAADLESELGRSEVRIRSAAAPLPAGRTVTELGLPSRLEAAGYRRVHRRPERPGEYFWGHETFWIYRRGHPLDGRWRAPRLVGLDLRRRDGMVLGVVSEGGTRPPGPDDSLEPEVLSESLDGDRAPRRPVALSELPDHAWRCLLAAEDARFFDHSGIDARGVARALLKNVLAGRVEQGGSTITQQLIKMRDLTPRRTVGRKLSEAVRALALEAEYDKRDILEAYLNHVYYGHADGLALHGIGTAARAYFSKDASDLELGESALLAALVQGPNRLSPTRHPERARARRDWVLGRMAELGWAEAADVAAARSRGLGLDVSSPPRPLAPRFVAWVGALARSEAPRRAEQGRGLVVETQLDPRLQRLAEDVARAHLARLRRDYRALRGVDLGIALVALDADTGGVLAHVGGDPDRPGFDRARSARRQPGSTVKPLLLLEAFQDCGDRSPLTPASHVLDAPLRIELPSGPWSPANPDGAYRGAVDVRSALRDSLNVPFVRIGRWCGFEHVASRLRAAGLSVPQPPPPAFTLGALEVTPLELASAYTVLATPGQRLKPLPATRVEKPGGRRLARFRASASRVCDPSTAFLVRDLLRTAVRSGTARPVAIDGLDVAAKTGTSSSRRDAWIAGHVEGVVAVVWVGRDDGAPLGLTGGAAAGPAWRDFMAAAVRARPPRPVRTPPGVVERTVDPRTGMLVRSGHRRAQPELFRQDALPPRKRFWRRTTVPVVE